MKRFIAILTVLMLTLALFSGCKTAEEEDFSASGAIDKEENEAGTEKEDENDSDPTEKDPSQKEENPSEKEENPSSDNKKEEDPKKEETKPDEDPKEETKPESSAPAVDLTLNSLQDATKAVAVAKGETVWFGPVASSQETLLTLEADGKKTKIAIQDAKETAAFGTYRFYSYTAAAAGSLTAEIGEGYADRYLLSKGQEMTPAHFFYYWDTKAAGGNLYHRALDLSNERMNWRGKTAKSTDYSLTHPVQVSAGDTLTFGPVNAGTPGLLAALDAKGNATLVSSGALKENGVFPKGQRIYTYTVPEGVTAVRVSVPADAKENFAMTKNKEFDANGWASMTGGSAAETADPLKGKTALFVGDSVCEGWKNGNTGIPRFPDAYAGLIEKQTGIKSINAGVGSSTIADEKAVFLQFENYKNTDFDYVVIQGGINDMSHNIAIGEMSDSFNGDDFDISTYAGGLEFTICKAIEYYGDTAAIGVLFSYASPNHPSGRGARLPEYVAVGKQICEKWGISYLDMCNHQEITQKLNFTEKINTGDFIHLNAKGYEIVTPYIIDFMRSMSGCSQKALEEVLK